VKPGARRWWWLLLVVPLIAGFCRLRFDVEVLDLLPDSLPSVHGLKVYQKHFGNADELIITVKTPTAGTSETLAQSIARSLVLSTNLVAEAIWQAPWLAHPEQTSELMAHLWLNQPPEVFQKLAQRLSPTNLPTVLEATREQLATTLSPTDIAQLSYDPFGLTRLPENAIGSAPNFARGGDIFASADGTFRLIFVKARGELPGYRECGEWLAQVKSLVEETLSKAGPAKSTRIGYTGRPAFVAEISASMRRDIIQSVGGTSIIIGFLFWLAHRRWKPMLWLLTLLALILAGTLGLGGLIFGTISVISMGFAAILLGLAVDYAVVHYQEALAHPDLSVPEVRRTIAPSIFWAAMTTITAFMTLNLGGLPGLAQLGSLVAVGVALSALVMIFAYLPPLFPERRKPRAVPSGPASGKVGVVPLSRGRASMVFGLTTLLVLSCAGALISGLPSLDNSADALKPRESQAYSTLDAIKSNLGQKREPLWLVVNGTDETTVARRLEAVEPVLNEAVSNQVLAGFTLPTAIWPRPEFQSANRATARLLVAERGAMRTAALTNGFSEEALGLAGGILDTWERAAKMTNVFWPDNTLSRWIFERLASHEGGTFYAAGFLYPSTNNAASGATFAAIQSRLPPEVWLSGWDLLGETLLGVVKGNLWKLVLPMAGLVLLSLWLAFGRIQEVALSLGILVLSGLGLLAVMNLMGWSWNLLNLMALPLILGTGVDYSIFMQLALRRYHGNLRLAHSSVGRALLLCGGTAVSGFGSLGLSSNAGMASLGQVCAIGIGANMLASVFLLPVWWKSLRRDDEMGRPESGKAPSSLYRAWPWRLGLAAARSLPAPVLERIARCCGRIYWRLAGNRREVVVENLLPVLGGDRGAAESAARELFEEFALKLARLWRHESGAGLDGSLSGWIGWERFAAAQARHRGVLLVTPHLGDWELGGVFMARKGIKLLVLTQPEPDPRLTELRRVSRARWGIETLVVGTDPFAFVEIIKRLQDGATVALLVDRPPTTTAVTVEMFGKPFQASVAPAELARASGCALLPVFVARGSDGYSARVLPEIAYDRAALGNRPARIRLTQEIVRALEPFIQQHAKQWYHFVPIWTERE